MAMTLAENAPPGIDLAHVIRILTAHDLIKVYAGDHWAGDGIAAKVLGKEQAAAVTLFGLLPSDRARHMSGFWREYEARQTVEACFVRALDALHPMLMVRGPAGTDHTHAPLTAAFTLAMKRPVLKVSRATSTGPGPSRQCGRAGCPAR